MTFSDDNTHGTIESACSHMDMLQFRRLVRSRAAPPAATADLAGPASGTHILAPHAPRTLPRDAPDPCASRHVCRGQLQQRDINTEACSSNKQTGTPTRRAAYACVRRGRMTTASLHNAQQRRICATRALSAHAVQQGDMVDARRRTSTSTGAASDSTSRACCRPRGG